MKLTRNTARKILGIFVCVFVGHVSTTAFAADYYVSNTGTAAWPNCTNINTPCSLQTGGNNAVAGDTVYLRGGTYVLQNMSVPQGHYWKIAFTPANSGTSGNPITFQAYNGEVVYFDNSNNAGKNHAVASYGVYNANGYVVFDGIDTATAMSNGEGRAVLIKSTSNVTVKNAEIQGGSGGTTNNNCIRLEGSSGINVENCKLWGSTGDSTNSSGITLYSVSGSTIKNCTFYSNSAGIHDKDGSVNNTYSYNLFYSNITEAYGLATESNGPNPHGLRLSHNIFTNNGRDLNIRGGKPKSDVTLDNNTFYGSGGGVFFWLNYGINGLDVYNNIFQSKSPATRYENSTDVYSDYNNFHNSTGSDSGANSITSNPNLVNPGGNSPEDYKRTSYPQDGRGGSYPSVIGAYITGNEVIGYNSGGAATPPPPTSPPPIGTPQGFSIEAGQ